jgi:hypothetical protein
MSLLSRLDEVGKAAAAGAERHDREHDHDHDGERRGLSLEHTELILTGDVDRNFRGSARFAVAPDGGVEVEEASFATLGLPRGLPGRRQPGDPAIRDDAGRPWRARLLRRLPGSDRGAG